MARAPASEVRHGITANHDRMAHRPDNDGATPPTRLLTADAFVGLDLTRPQRSIQGPSMRRLGEHADAFRRGTLAAALAGGRVIGRPEALAGRVTLGQTAVEVLLCSHDSLA